MKLIYLSFFLTSFSFASVQVGEGNLTEYINGSPGVLSLKQRMIAAEKLKGSLVRSFLPQVELTYGQENFSTGPYDGITQYYGGIEGKINLYNSGKDALENERRHKASELAQLNSAILKARVLSEARKAMAALAYLEELEKIIKEAIVLNEKNIEGAKKRIKAGLATSTDLLDFEQQKITLNQEFENIKFEEGVLQRLLATLLNFDPDVKVTITHVNSHPEHTETLEASEARESILIHKTHLQSEMSRLEVKTAKRWWGPKLDLYGYALRFTQKEREFSDPDDRNDITFGLRFTLPLFDGGEGIRQAAAQSALARAQEYQVRQKTLEVEKEIIDAKKKVELAHALIHGAEESVELMSKYRQGILSEYARGIKNSPDVLQATQRWISAKNKFAEVKRNYQFARAEALYLIELNSGEMH